MGGAEGGPVVCVLRATHGELCFAKQWTWHPASAINDEITSEFNSRKSIEFHL